MEKQKLLLKLNQLSKTMHSIVQDLEDDEELLKYFSSTVSSYPFQMSFDEQAHAVDVFIKELERPKVDAPILLTDMTVSDLQDMQFVTVENITMRLDKVICNAEFNDDLCDIFEERMDIKFDDDYTDAFEVNRHCIYYKATGAYDNGVVFSVTARIALKNPNNFRR